MFNPLDPFGIFKKNKKNNKTKQNEKPKVNLESVSSSEILIKVYKHFGSNTSFLKAQYKAREERDIYNNLISINEQYKHNEDTDFSIDDVYREMEIILEFKNLDISKKKEILNKKIEKQDTILRMLDTYPIFNSIYNYCDEALKSRDLKILLNYVKYHDSNGAYFTIENGARVYSFESVDGVLIPIWHGVDTYSQNPDHTRKLKINIQEDQRLRKELAEYNKEKKLGQLLTTGLIFCMILFVVLLFAGYKVWDKSQTLDEKLYGQANNCVAYTSNMNKNFAEIMENEFISKILENYIKEEANKEISSEEIKKLEPNKILNEMK